MARTFSKIWSTLIGSSKDTVKLREGADSLIILLHGWTESPASFDDLIGTLESTSPNADIYAPAIRLPFLSLQNLDEAAQQILKKVKDFIADRADTTAYKKIILAGHSCGGINARLVLLHGYGVTAEQGEIVTPRQATYDWVSKIERVVLLAAVNRGWTVSSAMSPAIRFFLPIALGMGNILTLFKTPTIFQIRRGATLITNMRLKWLHVKQNRGELLPRMIQVLGTIDDLVSPDDNIDLTTGNDFIYLEVPQSGHFDVLKTADAVHGKKRAAILSAAFNDEIPDLENNKSRIELDDGGFKNELATSAVSFEQETTKKRSTVACFIIHGIRDNGFWTKKVGQRICNQAKEENKSCFVYTPSYGFFPLISFAFPWTRRSKVEWFMDLYVDVVSRHPDSELVYLGHSNGTYLVAKALTLCPSMKFDRVLFAGSVIRREYDWPSHAGQVLRIVNLVATNDWVVAIFPRFFELTRMQDLGSAGHNGFLNLPNRSDEKRCKGNHGAGINEALWDDLANYAVSGKNLAPEAVLSPEEDQAYRKTWHFKSYNYFGPLIWLIIFGGLFLLAQMVLFVWPETGPTPHWQVAFVFSFCLLIVGRVLTKF